MPLTIAMRQAPMVWKQDLICRRSTSATVRFEGFIAVRIHFTGSDSEGSDRAKEDDENIRRIRRHP